MSFGPGVTDMTVSELLSRTTKLTAKKMPTRARIEPVTSPLTGGTRGAAKDASERVKAQAVILFYKKVAAGMKKLAAYAYAASTTDNSESSVRTWVRIENEQGMDGLESDRSGDQPARSPDLNVLDLYVWRVLEAGVHRRRPKTLTELWTAIKASWDEDLTEDKLECAYRLLTPVMGLINDKNGGNNFTLPHTGIRKAMREDGWEI
jgi:hypothetical protein